MPCDPFEMAVIHRAFRTEFGTLPGLIRAVAPGDVTRSKSIGSHLDNMIAVLHHHHAAEDEVLWPKLQARIPSREKDVRRVADQHAGIADAIDEVQAVRSSWVDSADRRLAEQLAVAVDGLSACVNSHLEDEEENIVPLIAQYITAEEWQAGTKRGAAFLTPRNVVFAMAFAGFILREATSDEQRRFLAGLPFGPRLLWKLLGRRLYAWYGTKLYGAPA